MTGLALQTNMRARQAILRLRIVIERPVGPRHGDMAGRAIAPEPSLMPVVILMALDAGGGRVAEARRRVAGAAFRLRVRADQRKRADAVIEPD